MYIVACLAECRYTCKPGNEKIYVLNIANIYDNSMA